MGEVFRTAKGKDKIIKLYNEGLKMWPKPNKQIMIPTSYGDTFVIASGKEGADAIILFHGSSTNSAIWTYDAQVLGETHKVYAVDIIGEPGKSAESRPALECETYSGWITEVMDGLGIDKAAVVGKFTGRLAFALSCYEFSAKSRAVGASCACRVCAASKSICAKISFFCVCRAGEAAISSTHSYSAAVKSQRRLSNLKSF